jgi:serine phosphatase RsbU (regulator of sigma subunit)/predicted ester cyclase
MRRTPSGGIILMVSTHRKSVGWPGEEEEASVSVEEDNKALVRRFTQEVANQGNLDVADELLAPDFVDYDVIPEKVADIEDVKRNIAELQASFSDYHFSIEEQVAEGDKVVNRTIFNGTHDQKEYRGVIPSGARITMETVDIHRVIEGKIVEARHTANTAGFWQQRLQRERIERERVEQELQVARRIQQAALPKEVPKLQGWHISPYYQPAREVGGDFYDFFELEDERLGLVVGDATGHGVPAALVMASARSMLRAVAQASYSPGDVLRRVNDPLATDIPPNMFVTCFYAILDPKNGNLTYANAGHDLPYLHRNGEAEELRATGMPLGLMPGMGYEEKQTILEAGESVLFYSDGLVEAHDPKGEMFGFPRLRALVAEHGELRSLGDFLLEELYSFVGEGWEQEDDITLLTLQRSATLG